MPYNTSLWPRSGGDSGNRSRMSIPGPIRARILRRIPLPSVLSAHRGSYPRLAGGMVTSDGTLRIAFRGMLVALSNQGDLLWAHDLRTYAIRPDADPFPEDDDHDPSLDAELDIIDDADSSAYHSLPCLIGQHTTLITTETTAAMIDAHGQLIRHVAVAMNDDTGLAPNRDWEGIPLLTTIGGTVWRWDATGLHDLGCFGYDIEPVAVFADNSFAVAGYAGSGFCRVHGNGTRIWQTTLKDADLLPTINRQQTSVVGSLNDDYSIIFAADGTPIGTYPHAAVFADYLDGGWIAQSKQGIARLAPAGHVAWAHTLTPTRWNRSQPVVDSQGSIYTTDGHQLIAFTGTGQQVFALALHAQPGPIFPVRPGVVATVVGDEVLFID